MIKKIMLSLGVILILIITGCSLTGGTVTKTSTNSLAKCLTEKNIVMYGTEWCSHCQNQKKLFGNDFKDVTFVDCDQNPGKCDAAGVTGYPTWKIMGKNYPGEMSLSQLASLSGCKN